MNGIIYNDPNDIEGYIPLLAEALILTEELVLNISPKSARLLIGTYHLPSDKINKKTTKTIFYSIKEFKLSKESLNLLDKPNQVNL